MDDRLRKAFTAVKAEKELVAGTQDFLWKKTRGYAARPSRRLGWAAAAACLLFLLGLGAGMFFTPVSAISIDINPSLKLSVNQFDRVVAVEGCNEDGRELLQDMNLLFMDYAQALDTLLADQRVQAYLERGDRMSIYVACDDSQRGQEMLAAVEHCAGGQGNVHCRAGDWAQTEAAREAGLPIGKYQAFLELQALDPSVTPEDVQGMTMREIRERIAALSGGGAEESHHEEHSEAEASHEEEHSEGEASPKEVDTDTQAESSSSCQERHGAGHRYGHGHSHNQE